MKILSQPVEILEISEDEEQTFLTVGLDISKEQLLKYKTPQGIFAMMKFYDSKRISDEQRKKIFAILNDISDYIGDPVELIRYDLTSSFCIESGQDFFSLSDCSLEVAREFISYLIEYVIANDIPLMDLGVNRAEDIDKYLYACIKFSKCCICGKEAIVYTLGDKTKICMCDVHRNQCKAKGFEAFTKLYKVYGIRYSS